MLKCDGEAKYKHGNTTSHCINQKCDSNGIEITGSNKIVTSSGTFTKIAKCLKCGSVWRLT